MRTLVTTRDLTLDDSEWFLALNNGAVPHVNALERSDLAAMLAEASLAWAVVVQGRPAGGLIAFAPGTSYDSANYLWFQDRYSSFLYIDRVVIDPASRGLGLGARLYDGAIETARDCQAVLCCEVNERPANPGSMRFHERFGFKPVGRQQTEGGKKSVVLLALTP